MKELFVIKGSTAYAAKVGGGLIASRDEVNSLVEGALAVFTMDGTLVEGDETSFTTPALYFATKLNGVPKISQRIYRPFEFFKSTAVSAAAKVMVVGSNTNAGTTYGLNLPSSLVVGTTAGIVIDDPDLPYENQTHKKPYEVMVQTGDTRATLVARLIAKINADVNRLATAAMVDTTNSNGFKLTSVDATKNFTVSCRGILVNADVLEYKRIVNAGTAGLTPGFVNGLTTVVVAYTQGRGTAGQILETETEYAPMDGDGPREKQGQNLYNQISGVVSGEAYVTSIIRSKVPSDNPLIPKNNFVTELEIAIPSSEYGTGEAGTLLDAIVAAFNV